VRSRHTRLLTPGPDRRLPQMDRRLFDAGRLGARGPPECGAACPPRVRSRRVPAPVRSDLKSGSSPRGGLRPGTPPPAPAPASGGLRSARAHRASDFSEVRGIRFCPPPPGRPVSTNTPLHRLPGNVTPKFDHVRDAVVDDHHVARPARSRKNFADEQGGFAFCQAESRERSRSGVPPCPSPNAADRSSRASTPAAEQNRRNAGESSSGTSRR